MCLYKSMGRRRKRDWEIYRERKRDLDMNEATLFEHHLPPPGSMGSGSLVYTLEICIPERPIELKVYKSLLKSSIQIAG